MLDIYINKTRNIIRLAVAGALILLAVFVLLFSITFFKEDPLVSAMITFAALFLFFAMAHTWKLLTSHGNIDSPVLTISKEGVFDRRVTTRLVPWDNLEWRYIVIRGTASISFNILNNENEFVKEQGFLYVLPNMLAKLFCFPKFLIPLATLKANPLDIKAEFEKHKQSI